MSLVGDAFLRDLFNKVDKDRSGRITAFELQQALSNGTWKPFNIETVKLMIAMFDVERRGTITFQDFGALWKFVTDWQSCFRSFDRDNSGTIDKGELSTALTTFGYHFSPQTISTLLAKFGHSGRGNILFDDFIQCCVLLHTLKEIFQRQDANHDGFVTLQYENFVQMVMKIKI